MAWTMLDVADALDCTVGGRGYNHLALQHRSGLLRRVLSLLAACGPAWEPLCGWHDRHIFRNWLQCVS